ncbi:MAG: Fic family protein [Bacteroidales bacterium]|nr:Fic family protein [Bacteroidales bacterium]
MLNRKESEIISFLKNNPDSSSKDIHDGITISISYATVKRILAQLISENLISKNGQGKGTKYFISVIYELLDPIDPARYYEKEIDERQIRESFNHDLIPSVLHFNDIFTRGEYAKLEDLQTTYRQNISQLSGSAYRKELEKLAIDLSWKSSQIEGNTYSLLETERLLKEKETAAGKTKEEAIMLLNHKEAIDFIIENPGYLSPLAVPGIEDIHRILVKELAIDFNLRNRRIGITGTNYRPLDNVFQIREALANMCDLVNRKENVFEKALLSLVLISYIQPFMDGNKRTARIVSNAVLIYNGYCPMSFRTVDSVEYKKAILLFYEQNNISYIKDIFISQFEFSVRTYF